MAQSVAIRRLKQEYAKLEKDPAPGAIARPLETNFLHAHFLFMGDIFYDTPYEGGVYHGVLKFPSNYPMKPPSVIMRTPSGRFEPDKKICFSLSDFHPELWNPMWSIRTILTGLVSFMNSDEITTGGLSASASHRRDMAKKSLTYCLERDALAKELFASELEQEAARRATLGTAWPPTRPAPTRVEPPPNVEAPSRKPARRARTKPKPVEQEEPEEVIEEEEQPSTSEPGRNAAKNRKKREKEKRKKLTKKFLTTLSEQVPTFLDCIQSRLFQDDMDVSSYEADHVCWRTETVEEYTELVLALKSATDDCTLLIESEIGGRMIATFMLKNGIQAGDRTIDVVEIPAPKDGSPYSVGLEHVEFVISSKDNQPTSPMNDAVHQSTLDAFMNQHPSFQWNTKAMDKDVNPDVSLKVELDEFGVCGVKFHLMPLAKVIQYEKDNCV